MGLRDDRFRSSAPVTFWNSSISSWAPDISLWTATMNFSAAASLGGRLFRPVVFLDQRVAEVLGVRDTGRKDHGLCRLARSKDILEIFLAISWFRCGTSTARPSWSGSKSKPMS